VKAENPHGRADQFLYTLRLSVGPTGGLKRYETLWFDETGGMLPLLCARWARREHVIKDCSPRT
jgi:hypothetical protein